jgi:hypothetical protein
VTSFAEDIAKWRAAAADRAPSYHQVLEDLVGLLGEPSVAERFEHVWRERTFRAFYDRPLLALASLRRDALAEGPGHPLWRAIGARDADPSKVTRRALVDSFDRASFWDSLATRFVQTNETSRAVSWLWPATILRAPVALAEIGTAAGLNLVADHLETPWTRASGERIVFDVPKVVSRWGIDAHPLDACDDDDALWLRACVWAGENERIDRLEQAIAAFGSDPVTLEKGDAADAPRRLRGLPVPEGGVVIAVQTLVRDYLPPATRSAYEQGMREWLSDTPRAVWVELEMDPADPDHGVPITAHVRDQVIVLGRTSYHPTTVAVDENAVTRFAAMFG